MKAQKLGLVLGINIAAACLVLQGCKAKQGGKVQPSPTDRVTVISRPAPTPAPAPRPAPVVQPQALPVQPIQQEPVIVETTLPPPTTPVVQNPPPPLPPPAPAPSAVRTVKPLPAVPARVVKAKPAAPAKSVAAPAASTEYVVKPGDTLFLISKRTNYRQAAILAANPDLKADHIRVGQKIKLPGAVAAPAVAKAAAPAAAAPAVANAAAPTPASAAKDKDDVKQAAAPAPAAANTQAPIKTKSSFVPYEGPTKEYVVKSGDSLGKIAKDSGISIRAIKALNGLQRDNLRVGQKLKIPSEKQTAAKPAVQADPVKDASTKPAVAANGDDAKAAPVQEAAAPKPAAQEPAADAPNAQEPAKPEAPAATKPEEPPAPKPEAAAQPVEEKPAALTHTVKEGEDLVSIAIAYGVSPSALMDINDLKPSDEVKPDQVLKLPANAKSNAQ